MIDPTRNSASSSVTWQKYSIIVDIIIRRNHHFSNAPNPWRRTSSTRLKVWGRNSRKGNNSIKKVDGALWNRSESKWIVQCVLQNTENGNSCASTHRKIETLSRNRLKYVKVEKAPVSAIYYSCVNIFLFPPTSSLQFTSSQFQLCCMKCEF